MKNLNDKVAVITGGGSGIGRCTAVALARQGCHIAIADIDNEAANQTATMVKKLGVNASVHQVDVSDKQQMEKLPEAVLQKHNYAHIVVNNAGIGVLGAFDQQSIEDLEKIIGINIWGVVYGCKFFLDAMKNAGEGHIVNISSLAGLIPVPGFSSYCATKFAVRGLSESIRYELADDNIGVTSVHPGFIATNFGVSTKLTMSKLKERRSTGLNALENYGHSPEKVAKKIVDGIIGNHPRVLIGWEAHLFNRTRERFPVFHDAIAKRVMGLLGTY